MKKVVILQPMFLPWAGVFNQIKLADMYIHFDDVQMPQGSSFVSRVQVKTPSGVKWLTAPIKREHLQAINEVEFDNSTDWKIKHLRTIKESYTKSSFFNEIKDLVDDIYSFNTNYLCEFNINAIEKISSYLGLKCIFEKSSIYNVSSHKTERLLEIMKKVDGKAYITGHGAKNYFDYDLFENNNLRVEYIDYKISEYKQLHGEYTPYVSIIDLIANAGKKTSEYLLSTTKYWRDFLVQNS